MFALPCLLFQADCFVRGLTLRSNNVGENLCMRPNIGPAAAGPAGLVATALCMWFSSSRAGLTIVPLMPWHRAHRCQGGPAAIC